ncbi:hypothetical protein BDK51DRAFT_43154 [Blyttiomyces helicus]|uniref:Uncharacterized protein n=1 Tax=Blyttiomyces helicus TaxID=388810 RepID=A0A4P9W907_9FUNG|nr:hypothetical protein BDK51DRAFT_43154 [Blyttiomyces helicus]|eukprot:RKO87953.1 hypothetical protein BDK51DRAFT_43154 [Blyttiomyces helicus]
MQQLGVAPFSTYTAPPVTQIGIMQLETLAFLIFSALASGALAQATAPTVVVGVVSSTDNPSATESTDSTTAEDSTSITAATTSASSPPGASVPTTAPTSASSPPGASVASAASTSASTPSSAATPLLAVNCQDPSLETNIMSPSNPCYGPWNALNLTALALKPTPASELLDATAAALVSCQCNSTVGQGIVAVAATPAAGRNCTAFATSFATACATRNYPAVVRSIGLARTIRYGNVVSAYVPLQNATIGSASGDKRNMAGIAGSVAAAAGVAFILL